MRLLTRTPSLRRTMCSWTESVMPRDRPSPDRTLAAIQRPDDELGSNSSRKLREQGRVPVSLIGDRLPNAHLHVCREELMKKFLRRVHFQRELLTMVVEGGETRRCLPQEVQYDSITSFNVKHVTFRRWPRDPQTHPVKLAVPIVYTNEMTHPNIRAGGYTMDVFAQKGLPCLVRDPEHVPRYIEGDMRKAVGSDLRFEHLELPPGVTVRDSVFTRQNGGNFLVGRVKRIRG